MRWLVSILLLLSIATASWGAVAFDAVSNGSCVFATCTASSTTLTYSHTTGSGSDRAIVVGVCVSGLSSQPQPSISTVTYAGVGLSSKKHQGGNYYCEYWSLADGVQPATGANNVVIVLSGSLPSAASNIMTSATMTFTGVDQTTAWTSTDNGNSGNGTSATLTLSASGADDMGADFVCNGDSVTSTTETSKFIAAANTNGACNTLGAAIAAGADTSLSWTVGNDNWILIGGALKAAGSASSSRRRQIGPY